MDLILASNMRKKDSKMAIVIHELEFAWTVSLSLPSLPPLQFSPLKQNLQPVLPYVHRVYVHASGFTTYTTVKKECHGSMHTNLDVNAVLSSASHADDNAMPLRHNYAMRSYPIKPRFFANQQNISPENFTQRNYPAVSLK
ncbi:hypothetical protein T4B_4007 [Trichinella pseudospiralis]|uniref:Uncharacterized protein n=1 Tax=Trichinella pseudospiralis TaxID=6337 RepID=A0A0V1JXE4_TRIPS|nr:hypothetical protein T4B_4007 [Trichinella pseudospiralis]KRZ39189.1 hypothetical protein T4C_9738 [Trichinella pseudospiralis]